MRDFGAPSRAAQPDYTKSSKSKATTWEQTSPSPSEEEEKLDPKLVHLGVIGAALSTSGMLGAFAGLLLGSVALWGYEEVSGKSSGRVMKGAAYAGLPLVFALGMPAALLQSDNKSLL
jgi:hypothetical protein